MRGRGLRWLIEAGERSSAQRTDKTWPLLMWYRAGGAQFEVGDRRVRRLKERLEVFRAFNVSSTSSGVIGSEICGASPEDELLRVDR